MTIVHDTNVWLRLLNPGQTPVKDRFRLAKPEEIRLCCVATKKTGKMIGCGQVNAPSFTHASVFLAECLPFGSDHIPDNPRTTAPCHKPYQDREVS